MGKTFSCLASGERIRSPERKRLEKGVVIFHVTDADDTASYYGSWRPSGTGTTLQGTLRRSTFSLFHLRLDIGPPGAQTSVSLPIHPSRSRYLCYLLTFSVSPTRTVIVLPSLPHAM